MEDLRENNERLWASLGQANQGFDGYGYEYDRGYSLGQTGSLTLIGATLWDRLGGVRVMGVMSRVVG